MPAEPGIAMDADAFLHLLPVPRETFHFLLDLLSQYPVTGGERFRSANRRHYARKCGPHKIYTFNTQATSTVLQGFQL